MHIKTSNLTKRRLIVPAVLCIICTACITAAAQSVVFEKNEYTYFFENECLNEGWIIHDGIFMSDGEPAYCIEPDETVVIGEDRYETGSWETYSGYSRELRDQITEYSCFGYGSEGSKDMESWYATQLLIWKTINPVLGNTKVWRDKAYDGSRYMSDQTEEITPMIRERMDAIETKTAEYHRDVDPVLIDESGNELSSPVTVMAGEKVIIRDNAQVLQNYSLMNDDPSITQSGNEVMIDTRTAGVIHPVFHYAGIPDSIKGAPLVLKSRDGSKIQTLVIRGTCPVKSFETEIHVNEAKLRLIKRDSLNGAEPLNEASFSGAQYELRNETQDFTVAVLTVNAQGYSDVIGGLNIADTYSLRETVAPKGYQLDEQTHTFTLQDLSETDGVYEIEMQDEVILGKMALHKVIANRESSDLCVNEKGAHFAVLSASSIAAYGSFEEALKHYDEIHPLEKAKIITDENGYGESGMLAYGAYTVRQIQASGPDLQLCGDFSFTIDQKTDQPLLFEVSNLPSQYRLKIIKKDAASGTLITRTPAVFEIYDAKGNKVIQKVGSAEYDTFMSACAQHDIKPDRNVYADTASDPGTLVLPLSLPAGSYELREVKAPYGFHIMEKAIPFVIGSSAIQSGGQPFAEVSVNNEQIKGSLRLKKTITDTQCGRSLIPQDLSGIRFSLTAGEDILSCTDGSLLYGKGTEVTQLITDKDGNAFEEGLPCGEYLLRETQTLSNLILSEKEYRFSVTPEQTDIEIEAENSPVLTVFSKKHASGTDELPGAHLCVTDEQGTIVDEWVSGTVPHIIAGLSKEQTYILKETIPPSLSQGGTYVKAEEIRFTPVNDPAGSTVEMRNGIVSVGKYTKDRQPLAGACFEVIDELGEVKDEWESDGTEHIVNNLCAGITYTLRETSAPAGYYRSYETQFTPKSTEDLVLEVNNAPIRVTVSKLAEDTGKLLEGVTLTLYEQTEEDETIIASWQSGKEPMQIGPYLKAGTSYRLEESAAVEGVYTAADVYFTTETYDPMSDADVNIIMIDAAVRLGALKSDESGSPLTGAKLGLYDPEGTLLHEWTSEKRIEDLSSYVKGDGTYVLKEISAPQGYALSDPLVFTVKGNSAKNQLLRMIDRNVRIHLSVHKTDSEDGSPLSGAQITVYHASGNREARDVNGKRATGTTDENGEVSFVLPYDPQGYYVRETKAPKGYSLNRSRFDLSGVSENNPPVVFEEITITDSRKTVPTGIGARVPALLWASLVLALIAAGVRCVNGYGRSHRRRH